MKWVIMISLLFVVSCAKKDSLTVPSAVSKIPPELLSDIEPVKASGFDYENILDWALDLNSQIEAKNCRLAEARKLNAVDLPLPDPKPYCVTSEEEKKANE